MFNDLVMVGFSMSILFCILFWQQSFDQPLFEKSLTYIPRIQEGASTFKQKTWGAYSDFFLAVIGGGPAVISYLFISQRARSFYYIVASVGIDALTSVAKLNYHEAQPIWVSENVQAFQCSN